MPRIIPVSTGLLIGLGFVNLLFCGGCSVSSEQGGHVGSKVDEKYLAEISKLLVQKKKMEEELRLKQSENEKYALETARLLKENERLEKENLELRAKYIGDLPVISTPATLIKGKIKALNAAQNLVIISVGGEAGVSQGMEMNIYRGNQLIGKISINSVEKEWSIGRAGNFNVLKQLQLGDEVTNATK